jgi:hypothetical protein
MTKDMTTAQETPRNEADERHAPETDEQAKRNTNPRTGEDPGLLPLTEDPRERRLKRTTM